MIKLNPRFARLGEEFFSHINPTPILANPCLVHKNVELLKALSLEDLDDDTLTKITSGMQKIDHYTPLASIYMGHQFGVPVPQLGDGRAILIAEHEDPQGKIWELQLKGAGKTPYSRMGDGRAVLRSSIREYLVSHAMSALNIPTTLALSIVTSDDLVYREEIEKASIVMRTSQSFIRFGHFEFFARNQKQNELRILLNFVATNYFPDLNKEADDFIPSFMLRVVKLTAEMIAHWQSVGFVHGVMNSDNMSILGLTIDYGPYAFLDQFQPDQIFNHSDSEGRYTYLKQPQVAWWNLYRLAESLFTIYDNSDELEKILHQYSEFYNNKYTELMAAKLGLVQFKPNDIELLDELLSILQKYQVDWTYFWRRFSYGESGKLCLKKYYPDLFDNNFWDKLRERYQEDVISDKERQNRMLAINPAIVLRTHMLQHAINKANAGDYQEVNRLFNAVSNPFIENDLYNSYYMPAINQPHVVLSCSS